jgi:hypothetical protein
LGGFLALPTGVLDQTLIQTNENTPAYCTVPPKVGWVPSLTHRCIRPDFNSNQGKTLAYNAILPKVEEKV